MKKNNKRDGGEGGGRGSLGMGGGFEWEKKNEVLVGQLEENLGPTVQVFRELIPTGARVDVHLMGPTEELPFYKLVTVGMSQVEMPAPEEFAEYSRAELIMGLPEGWPVTAEAFSEDAHGWPVRALRQLARIPGGAGKGPVWVAAGHRVAFEGEMAGKFAGALLLPPLLLSEESQVVFNQDLEPVFLLGVVPLFAQEMAQEEGEGLLVALDEVEVTEILDLERVNTCGD
jgi:hypothetical protein